MFVVWLPRFLSKMGKSWPSLLWWLAPRVTGCIYVPWTHTWIDWTTMPPCVLTWAHLCLHEAKPISWLLDSHPRENATTAAPKSLVMHSRIITPNIHGLPFHVPMVQEWYNMKKDAPWLQERPGPCAVKGPPPSLHDLPGGGPLDSPPDQMHTWHHGVGREFAASTIAPWYHEHAWPNMWWWCHDCWIVWHCTDNADAMRRPRYSLHAVGISLRVAILKIVLQLRTLLFSIGVQLESSNPASNASSSRRLRWHRPLVSTCMCMHVLDVHVMILTFSVKSGCRLGLLGLVEKPLTQYCFASGCWQWSPVTFVMAMTLNLI